MTIPVTLVITIPSSEVCARQFSDIETGKTRALRTSEHDTIGSRILDRATCGTSQRMTNMIVVAADGQAAACAGGVQDHSACSAT